MRRELLWAPLWVLMWGAALLAQPMSVLEQMPHDARGYVLLSGLTNTSDKVAAITGRLRLPVPRLADMLGPYSQGLDKGRHAGLVWLPAREGDDPQTGLTHFVLYVPVTNYGQFAEQFGADGSGEMEEVDVDDRAMVIAKRGTFALVTPAEDKASLEHVLKADKSVAEISRPLLDWLARNDVSVALSPDGTQLMFTKLKEGLALIRAGAANVPGGGAEMVNASLKMYEDLFTAGQESFEQLALGIRIDPEKSVSLHSRILLAADGGLAGSEIAPPAGSLARMPGGPFVVAFEGVMPTEVSKNLMTQSFNMLTTMQGQEEKLSKEQIDRLSEVAATSMSGVKSMAFGMGVGKPGGGLYSEMVGVMRVEDAAAYMKQYQTAMSEMSKILADTKLAGMYEVKPTKVGDVEALQLSMDMTKFMFGGGQEIPQLEEFYKSMFGPGGKLSVYIAPAAKDAVVMAYVSTENLQRALAAYNSGEGGLGSNEQLQKTAQLLPESAHWVGYISPSGILQMVRGMMQTIAPDGPLQIPAFPACPPLGFAAELTPRHLDIQLVVPVEILDASMAFAGSFQNSN